MKAEIAEFSANPQGLLLEALHSAGYTGALANPLIAPEPAIHKLDSSILKEFIAVRSFNLSSIHLCCYLVRKILL